jgi:hypothetical protein
LSAPTESPKAAAQEQHDGRGCEEAMHDALLVSFENEADENRNDPRSLSEQRISVLIVPKIVADDTHQYTSADREVSCVEPRKTLSSPRHEKPGTLWGNRASNALERC